MKFFQKKQKCPRDMNSFPLYNIMYSETESSTEPMSSADKDLLCETMKKLDMEGFELCYGLMKCFAHEQNDDSSPPYNPKKNKTGYKFDIEDIPDRLLAILLRFSLKHVEKLKEESMRFVA